MTESPLASPRIEFALRLTGGIALAVLLSSLVVSVLAARSASNARGDVDAATLRITRIEAAVLTPCVEDNAASEAACRALARRVAPHIARLLTDEQLRQVSIRGTEWRIRRVVRQELERRSREGPPGNPDRGSPPRRP